MVVSDVMLFVCTDSTVYIHSWYTAECSTRRSESILRMSGFALMFVQRK